MSSLLQHKTTPLDYLSMASINTAAGYFAELDRVLHSLPYNVVDQITAVLVQAYKENRAVYLFGDRDFYEVPALPISSASMYSFILSSDLNILGIPERRIVRSVIVD